MCSIPGVAGTLLGRAAPHDLGQAQSGLFSTSWSYRLAVSGLPWRNGLQCTAGIAIAWLVCRCALPRAARLLRGRPAQALLHGNRIRILVAACGQATNATVELEGSLRVVSYNIKGFGVGFDSRGKAPSEIADAYGRILADIKCLRPNVLCLNEARRFELVDNQGHVRGDSLEVLAEDLGGMQVFFAHATPGFEHFGNAVLVSPGLEVFGSKSIHLDGGSVVRTKEGKEKRIVRGALAVWLRAAVGDGQPLAVLATHWDHISDAERKRQALDLCARSAELSGGLPHLLVGDLNSMKHSDYAPAEWEAIEQRNRQNGWGTPSDSESLRVLESVGYRDILELTLCGSGGGSLASVPAAQKMTAPAHEPNVRIDHAYLSPDLAQNLMHVGGPCDDSTSDKWQRVSASVNRDASGSDHLPLCVELRRRWFGRSERG